MFSSVIRIACDVVATGLALLPAGSDGASNCSAKAVVASIYVERTSTTRSPYRFSRQSYNH